MNPSPEVSVDPERLTLGELEALAGAGLTRFFTLFHARVAGQKTVLLERDTESFIGLQQSAGNREANRASLTGGSAAMRIHGDIKQVCAFSHLQWLEDMILQIRRGEILLKRFAVHFDLAGAGCHADARYCGLAASRCDIFLSLSHD